MRPLTRFAALAVPLSFAILTSSQQAAANDRAVMTAQPPIEPRTLFQMPTGGVVKSMDAEVSGIGVLFGDGAKPVLQAALGLGDIAQMEAGTLGIVSNIAKDGELTSVPSAGLKVHLPLGRFARGVAASFQRSGTHTDVVDRVDWTARVGEFHTVATLANHAPEDVTSRRAGWNGVKFLAHVGAKYIDSRLTSQGVGTEVDTERTYWRPLGGFEVWRDDARARIVGEFNWITGFDDTDGGSIEVIRVISGGVRFFFSKHATFDFAVRQQSNYEGIAESAIQTKLTFHLPTHALRDRVVGN